MGLFNTKSLEETKRENQRLRAEKEVREEMRARDKERASIQKENFNMKHEGKVRFVKKVGSGIGSLGRGIGKGITAVGEQYAKNRGSNISTNKKKRVRKVRKAKKVSRQRAYSPFDSIL